MLFYAGKPVVITHSKGLSAPTNPNSNLEYEKSLWRKHKGIDEGTDKDANEAADLNTHPSAHEIFHSMAEIASCSYEARKVRFMSFDLFMYDLYAIF